MKRIFKWSLELAGRQTLQLPRGAEILSVQMQGSWPQLWALCNPDQPKEARDIAIIGTGNEISEGPGNYIGTFQMHSGALVLHAFELIRAR